MRSFGIVSPQFWTGTTGREIQAISKDAVILASYLMTSPHSHMCGLYYITKTYMVDDTPLTIKEVSKALLQLALLPSGAFAQYDETSRYVWLPTMMRWQIGGPLQPRDGRVSAIIRWYRSLPNVPFLSEFYDRYSDEVPGLDRRIPVQRGAGEGAPTGAPRAPTSISIPALTSDSSVEGGAGETETAQTEPVPETFGEFRQVRLTAEQHVKLTAKLNGNLSDYIDRLDRYSQTDPKRFRKYQSHYAVILNWFDRDVKDGKVQIRAPDSFELESVKLVKEIFRKKT